MKNFWQIGSLLVLSFCGGNNHLAQKLTQDADPPPIKQEASGDIWGAAEYRGLIVGRSKRDDVLRVFGRAMREDVPQGQKSSDPHPALIYVYKDAGEFPGEFTVVIDKNTDTTTEMYLVPDSLSKEQAIEHFGAGFKTTRYDFCPRDNDDDEDGGPIFEAPNGSLSFIEYRSRGIALMVGTGGKIEQIQYMNKPTGFRTSKECKVDGGSH